jgi:transposase, IS30 family
MDSVLFGVVQHFKGAGNASAVGILVERASRLLMLVKLPHPQPASAANVLQAFTDKLTTALPNRCG